MPDRALHVDSSSRFFPYPQVHIPIVQLQFVTLVVHTGKIYSTGNVCNSEDDISSPLGLQRFTLTPWIRLSEANIVMKQRSVLKVACRWRAKFQFKLPIFSVLASCWDCVPYGVSLLLPASLLRNRMPLLCYVYSIAYDRPRTFSSRTWFRTTYWSVPCRF